MWDGAWYFVDKLDRLFLTVGSLFSLTSLVTALSIAIVFLVYRRRLKNRPVRALTILRALFPRRFIKSPSFHADLASFYFNAFAAGLMFGWAVLSYKAMSNLVIDGLNTAFGPTTPSGWSNLVVQSTITLLLFLAYEFGYWLDHFLKHRVPLLWEFHKVHHSANVLTPLTVYRIHPVDAIIFQNILVLSTGLTSGIACYAFGKPASSFTIDDTNLILVVFFHARRAPAPHASVDFVSRSARAARDEPGASPDPSFQQPDPLRQKPRQLSCGLGLDVWNAARSEQGTRESRIRHRGRQNRRAYAHRDMGRADSARSRTPRGTARATPQRARGDDACAGRSRG